MNNVKKATQPRKNNRAKSGERNLPGTLKTTRTSSSPSGESEKESAPLLLFLWYVLFSFLSTSFLLIFGQMDQAPSAHVLRFSCLALQSFFLSCFLLRHRFVLLFPQGLDIIFQPCYFCVPLTLSLFFFLLKIGKTGTKRLLTTQVNQDCRGAVIGRIPKGEE